MVLQKAIRLILFFILIEISTFRELLKVILLEL